VTFRATSELAVVEPGSEPSTKQEGEKWPRFMDIHELHEEGVIGWGD
jgi:hypothetical protein